MASERFSNMMPEQCDTLAEESRRQVAEHPLSYAVAAFGVGLGIGIVLATTLSGGGQAQSRNAAQRLGQQLLDSMSGVVPSSWTK